MIQRHLRVGRCTVVAQIVDQQWKDHLLAIDKPAGTAVHGGSGVSFGVIEQLTPSGRGEFEITDVLNHYIENGGLFTRHHEGRWHDAGTIESLLEASSMAAGDE